MRIHYQDKMIRLSDGRHLGYAEYGDPRGRPLLYFHGGVSSRLDIAFAAKTCAEKGIRLIAPDRPGTGLSCQRPNRTLLDWADDVEVLLDRIEIPSVPLLGWSLGGPYVFACAYKYPRLFHKIGTIGGASPFTDQITVSDLGLSVDRMLLNWPRSIEGLLSLSLLTASKLPSKMMKWSLMDDLTPESADHNLIRSLSTSEATDFVHEAFKKGAGGVLDDYRAIRNWGFELQSIQSRAHIWHGEQDIICPVSMAFHLADRLPQSVLHIVPEAGHFLLRANLDHVMDTMMAQP